MLVFGLASGTVVGGAMGFVAGAFSPSLGRKIKGIWVKDTQKGLNLVKKETSVVIADVKSKL